MKNIKINRSILKNGNYKENVLLTVGIPTYRRPNTLKRAINCLNNQSFLEFNLEISDNELGANIDISSLIQGELRINQISYWQQETANKGIDNFLGLLNGCKTKYFMWLADDDEVSPNYIEILLRFLEENDDYISAFGVWNFFENENIGNCIKRTCLESNSWVVRVFRFVCFGNDAFFYGIHRTEKIRDINFPGYFYPNNLEVINWCYAVLIKIVMRGKIHESKSSNCMFINHNYTAKNYLNNRPIIYHELSSIIRRLNIYLIYSKSILSEKGLLGFVFFIPIFTLLFLNDVILKLTYLIFSINKIFFRSAVGDRVYFYLKGLIK